jgi:hypothetical protein
LLYFIEKFILNISIMKVQVERVKYDNKEIIKDIATKIRTIYRNKPESHFSKSENESKHKNTLYTT